MPDKHLFVNSSHYQDRPDPNMRHRIASHAAKYGPNGSLAYKSSPEHNLETNERTQTSTVSRSLPSPSPSNTSTPRARSVSIASSPLSSDALFRRDYEALSANLSSFCICPKLSDGAAGRSNGEALHTEECTLLDDYLTLSREHELPFRVTRDISRSVADIASTPAGEGLVLQCLLVIGQAAIDGMDPKFNYKPSKRTLSLQQKALNAMQRAISKDNHTITDAIVLASALMLSTAAYYADSDAYRAHHSSLQKLIEIQGGFNQTQTHIIVKALIASGEIHLAHHRYMTAESRPPSADNKKGASPQSQTPFKLKYPMPPLAPEVTTMVEKMSPGFRALAKASKLSVHALQLLDSVCKWSSVIDQPLDSEAEDKLLRSKTAGADARLLNLYDDSVQTKRIATLLLVSLPASTSHMRLERCLCLGFSNLLHSLTLRPHPTTLRDQLVSDFADAIFSLNAKDSDEEDTMIWLALAVASEWRHCASRLKASPLPAQHGYDGVALSQIWIQKSRQVMDWLLVKHERARNWESLVAICSKFLWLRRLEKEWKQTWQGAMERRLRNMPRKKSRS